MSPELPSLSPRKVIQALNAAGFVLHRSRGSHHHFKHPDHPELLVSAPVHARDIKRPVLRSIIRQAGLTVEAFTELL